MVSGSGDFYGALVNVDLARALIAQGRAADAAAAVARIDNEPAPCDREWVVKRHARAHGSATRAGHHGGAVQKRAPPWRPPTRPRSCSSAPTPTACSPRH